MPTRKIEAIPFICTTFSYVKSLILLVGQICDKTSENAEAQGCRKQLYESPCLKIILQNTNKIHETGTFKEISRCKIFTLVFKAGLKILKK